MAARAVLMLCAGSLVAAVPPLTNQVSMVTRLAPKTDVACLQPVVIAVLATDVDGAVMSVWALQLVIDMPGRWQVTWTATVTGTQNLKVTVIDHKGGLGVLTTTVRVDQPQVVTLSSLERIPVGDILSRLTLAHKEADGDDMPSRVVVVAEIPGA